MKSPVFNTIALMTMALVVSGCLAPRFDNSPIHTAPIENAIAGNNIQRVNQLLQEGTDPNTRAPNGTPILNIAAHTNRVAISQLLLDRGADLESRDRNGLTALHAAAYSGSFGTAKVLIDRGAAVNAVTRSKMRPLNFATVNGFNDIGDLLRGKGAMIAPVTVQVGGRNLHLSVEAQEYLTIVSQSIGDLRGSILIVGEPHQHRIAQWKLFRGLSIFLRENPEFAGQTAFLAEGLARDREIKVDSLIAVEPKPDDCAIRTILDSFLITGYMAYEWRMQTGIKIFGIEDPELYQTSVALHLSRDEVPRHSVQVARNRSMAEAALSFLGRSQSPILFIGGGHLEKSDTGAFERSRSAAERTLNESVAKRVIEAGNLGVADILAASSVGYIYLESGVGNWSNVGSIDNELYAMIFRAQQAGTYEPYISQFASSLRPSSVSASGCK